MGKRNFYIARIDVEDNQNLQKKEEQPVEESKYKSEHFVSSFHGKKVKDVPSFPYIRYGNRGSQYEGLRDKRLSSDVELEQRHGTKYYEFTQIQGVKPKRMDEGEGDDQETQSINIQYKEDNIEEYTAEENHEEELGKLRDLPTDDEYDFNESVYSSNSYRDRERDLEFRNTREDVRRPVEPVNNRYNNSNNFNNSNNPNKYNPVNNVSNNYNNNDRTVEAYDTSRIKTAFPRKKRPNKYVAPPLSLLKRGQTVTQNDYSSVNFQKEVIDRTLKDFKIGGRVVHFTKGPSVTQFEIKLDAGVKVEKVKNIQRNMQMNLEGKSIRIEAPIPGKSTVGIEVPNIVQDKVLLGELLNRQEFLKDGKPLNTVLGIDIAGNYIDLDITEMPHALIAGTTGSGKSVCINALITSIIYKASPDQVRLVLIDPKLIEFAAYEDIPHLATPVINDPKLATGALKWAVDEMQNRYELFKACKRRDITSYNEYAKDSNLAEIPYIVIIIDELADLMFIAASTVEEYIQRLAQKARAAGIHLIMATQRPSTDVIKGTIKANMQTRIAFAVNSQVDSMTILDRSGADKLLGKGDMLYSDGVNEVRVQGAYISLEEILAVTDYVKENYEPNFMFSKEELTSRMEKEERMEDDGRGDEYFPIIAKFVVENDSASINRIQKEFGIGFNRAQNIMNALEALGVVSEGVAGKQRTVLITADELEDVLNY